MRVRCSTTSVSPWVNAAMGAAIGVSILAGGTLVGCGGDEPLSLGNAEVGLTADVADEAPDPVDLEPKTPSPEDIARQIERDREIIAAREAQRNRDHELRRPVGAPVVDRAIQWGSPDRTATNVNDDNERDWRDRPFTRTPATPLPSNTRTLEPADPNAIMDDIAGDTIDGDDPDGDNGERNATGTPTGSGDSVRDALVSIRNELTRATVGRDDALREVLALASTALIDPDAELPEVALRELTETERKAAITFHTFFRSLGRDLADGDSMDDHSEDLLSAIETLRRDLRSDPEIRIRNGALCSSVEKFGAYKPFPNRRFLAGTEQWVIIYLEVGDYMSRQNDGTWQTDLSQRVRIIRDHDGMEVWDSQWQSTVDRSRAKRTDFHTVYKVLIPKALGVGKFVMKVQVRDEQTGAEDETTLDFNLVADPSKVDRW